MRNRVVLALFAVPFSLLSGIAERQTWADDQVAVVHSGDRVEGYPASVSRVGSGVATVYSGQISVRTNVHITPNGAVAPVFTGVISIGYTGSAHSHCCWLQFAWDEILVTSGGTTTAEVGTLTTTGGDYGLTTDQRQPSYNVDSSSGTSPCYQSGGAHNDSGSTLVIFDVIGNSPHARAAARRPGVTRVDAITHFDSFYVCSQTVLVRVSWTMTFTWTPTTGWQGPATGVDPPDTSGARPNADQMARLNAEYPGQTVLP